MLMATVAKYKYPEEYNCDAEGDFEADFIEFRKEIKSIFMNIGMLVGANWSLSWPIFIIPLLMSDAG